MKLREFVSSWTPPVGVTASVVFPDGWPGILLRYGEEHTCLLTVESRDAGEIRRGLNYWAARLVRAADGRAGLPVAGECGDGHWRDEEGRVAS